MSILTVFNQSEINELLNEILSIPEETANHEGGQYYKGSLGFTKLPLAQKYVSKLEEIIKPIVGDDIAFENTYARIYKKDSFLGYHIDRPGLDITLSICLKRDASWYLWSSTNDLTEEQTKNNYWMEHKEYFVRNFIGIDTIPGDAGIMEGRKNPHWRDPLVCNDDQTNVYIFYHWRRT
jgi:hypothetical protein